MRTSTCKFYSDHLWDKGCQWSLSTLFASYSRIGTFVYCKIHIWNVTEFVGIIVLMQPYKLPSKNFGRVVIFYFLLIFIAHPACLPVLEKVRLCDHISLYLITCSFFYEISPNLLQLRIFLSIFYKPYNFQATTMYVLCSTFPQWIHVEWNHNS